MYILGAQRPVELQQRLLRLGAPLPVSPARQKLAAAASSGGPSPTSSRTVTPRTPMRALDSVGAYAGAGSVSGAASAVTGSPRVRIAAGPPVDLESARTAALADRTLVGDSDTTETSVLLLAGRPTERFAAALNVIFDRFDSDGDGALSLQELHSFKVCI